VQNISTGISSETLNNSYHALSRAQTGASEATHVREAWVQLKVSYAQSIPGQHFGKSNIHLYTET